MAVTGNAAGDYARCNGDDGAARRAADSARARLTDAMIQTGKGDHAAFREVYALTSAKLFGICLRVCGDRAAAQDVLHDAYLAIWKNAETWQPARSSPVTWLATIARNRAIDWRRAKGKGVIAPFKDTDVAIDPAPDPEVALLFTCESRLLHACLDRLEPRQAAAIKSAFLDGLTYSEIAQRERVPLATMKSRVRRGLARLKILLGDVHPTRA